jgi:hypothetical protein
VNDLAGLDMNLVNELAICANDGLRKRQDVITLSNLLVASRRREEPEARRALTQIAGLNKASDVPLTGYTIQVWEFVSCPELVKCRVARVRVDLVTELLLNIGVDGQRIQGHIEHD